MILLIAIIIGLVAGIARAKIRGQKYYAPELKMGWLLFIAVIPQMFSFHQPHTASVTPDRLAAGVLVSSQALLLIFVWANRKLPGFWALGIGLILNLVVIVLNGGLMPISPETVYKLSPQAIIDPGYFGTRLGSSKDILLATGDTRLWWLSDFLVFPNWVPYRVAFSFGDLFIALGAFLLFWIHGDIDKIQARYLHVSG